MKKLKKFIFKFSKKIIFKYFMTFSLIFTILFGSIYSCVSVAYGAEVLATGAKAVGYISSLLGLADKGSGGGITKIGGDTTSKIQNWWADNFNNGEIYETANGEYAFSGTATQELYNALNSDSSINARVVSNFKKQSSYGNILFKNEVSKAKKNYSNHLVASSCASYISGNTTKTFFKSLIFNVSNVAYIVISTNGKYTFYNKNGSKCYCSYYAVYQDVKKTENGDDDSYGNVGTQQGSSDYFSVSDFDEYNNNDVPYYHIHRNGCNPILQLDIKSTGDNKFYRSFPSLCGNGGVYCNKSIIVAQDVVSADKLYSGDTNIFISNSYETLPTISMDTFNNNDWDSIYNSYITNVQNESNVYYNSDTETFDYDALRQIMKKYSDNIQIAIESGTNDIADQVNYLNEWMSKIYALLGQIADLIDQNESGGTSGATDLTTVEGKLTAIQNYLETISGDTLEIKNLVSNLEDINNQLTSMQGDLDYIEDNYVILSNIYNYMIANPWGGGGHFKEPTDQPYDKWFKYLDDDDFPYGEILSKYNVLEQLLKGVAPFCFFAFASLVVNSLDVAAVEPVFDIPIQMDNALISVNENLTIDLTIFDSILPVTNALIIILWTMILLWSSFYLISHLLTILQL